MKTPIQLKLPLVRSEMEGRHVIKFLSKFLIWLHPGNQGLAGHKLVTRGQNFNFGFSALVDMI